MSHRKKKPAAVVVNDDITQQNVLAGLLAKDGIHVRTFGSAGEALAFLNPEDPPDLIVTDLYMPGIDGWRFCRLLRSPEYAAFNGVPILVVSATFAGEEASRITADLGANAFLASPVDGAAFLGAVRKLIAGEKPPEVLRILIVEDSRTLAGLLRKAFVAQGWRADIALTARAGAEAFENMPYDAAVLDYHLPDGTGDVLLDAIRTRRPDCVCIMMTTDPKPELALDWMQRGAAAYLRKPFDPAYLIELCARTRRERNLLRVEDVLERRTHQLRESEARYRSFFEGINDAAFVHELDAGGQPGRFLDCNEAACRRLGYTREELLSLTPRDITDPAEYERIARRRAEFGDRGGALIETIHVARDGSRIPVEGNVRRITYLGRPAALSVSRDITERKKAQEALEGSSRLLRSVTGMARLLITERNLDKAMNEALRELGEAIRVDRAYVFRNHVHPDDGRLLMSQVWEWTSGAVSTEIDNPLLQNLPYDTLTPDLLRHFARRETFSRQVKELEPRSREILESQGILSILQVPVYVGDQLWGLVGFDECRTERAWLDSEISILQTAADCLGSAVARSHAEESVRESEERYRSVSHMLRRMCDNVPDMIWAKDLERRYVFANRAVCRDLLSAADTVEPLGKTDMFFAERERQSRPEDPHWHTFGEICADSDSVVMAGGVPGRFEEFGNVKGRFLYLDVHKAPSFDDNGEMTGTVGSARDVTEHKRAEAALRESEEKYRLIFDNVGEAIFIAQDGLIKFGNHNTETLTGYTLAELASRPFVAFIHPDDRQLVIGRHLARLRGELPEADKYEFRIIYKSGESRTVQLSTTRTEWEGKPATINFLNDITERKRAEEAKRLNEERLEVLVELNNKTGAGERELTHFAMEAAVRLTGSTIGYIAFMNEDETVLTMYAWSEQAMRECAIADKPIVYPVASTGLWGEAVRRRRAVITNDYAAPNPWKKGTPDGHVRVMRHMNAPTFDGDRIVLVAGVGNKPTDYSDDDVRQLSLLMSGLWTLIHRRRDEEAERRREARRQRESEVIASIALSPNVTEGVIRELAVELTGKAARALEVERVGLWLFEAGETRLVNMDLFLTSTGEHSSGAVLLESEFRDEFEALKTAKYVDAHDPLTDPRTKGYVEGYLKPNRITSMLDAVIRGGGRKLGVLCFEHVDRPHRWEDDEIAFACQLADHVALAITHGHRLQAKRALRESEGKYRSLTERMNDLLWTCDLKMNTTYVSPSVERMLGFTVEERIRQRVDDQITPETLRFSVERLEDELRHDGEREPDRQLVLDMEYYHRDGSVKCLESALSFIRDAGGRPVGIQGLSRDVTAHKQAEAALRQSEERYRTILNEMEEGYQEVDLAGNFTFFNEAFLRLFGYGRNEMMGTNFSRYAAEEAIAKKVYRAYSRMYRTGIPIESFEWDIIRKDGARRTLEFYASILRDAENLPTGFRGIVRDVTDRRQAENKLRESEERLKRAEKMEALGQMAGGVAHDLNNVLGVLVGYSELLLEKLPAEGPMRKYAHSILQSGMRGAAIVDDLLTLARRGVSVSEVADLNRVVSDYLESPEFENLLDRHPQVRIRRVLEKELLHIKGSPVHLGKAVMNLVTNAAEAISGPGEVTVTTENRYLDRPVRGYDEVLEGDYVVVSVSDTGGGISAQDLGRIFEPFYTKKVMGKSGTGLGLSVVWGTVKDHGGYVDVHSEEGKGSVFALFFPVTREEPAGAKENESPAAYAGRGEFILVADDVLEQRELAASMLGSLGYRVETAASGEEAIAFLRDRKADLVVLDMIMDPGMDGLETYRGILTIHPGQRAVIVSGFSESERVLEARRLGAGAFVRKPYVMARLGSAVRSELDRGKGDKE